MHTEHIETYDNYQVTSAGQIIAIKTKCDCCGQNIRYVHVIDVDGKTMKVGGTCANQFMTEQERRQRQQTVKTATERKAKTNQLSVQMPEEFRTAKGSRIRKNIDGTFEIMKSGRWFALRPESAKILLG